MLADILKSLYIKNKLFDSDSEAISIEKSKEVDEFILSLK